MSPRPGAARAATPDSADDLRLVRLHLRIGMLSLALAELEDLERRGLLGAPERSMLAEARWRSGDADGAALAARAHLDADGDDPIAICIAAEAAAAEGRPGEARALMDRLGPPDAATLDALFAGMPRRAFWPSIPGETGEAETLFGDLGRPRHEAAASTRSAAAPAAAAAPVAGVARGSAIPGPHAVLEATQGLWPDTGAGTHAPRAVSEGAPRATTTGGGRPRAARAVAQEPNAELARARSELFAEPDRALLRLALTLRLDPTLAPAVLDIVSGRTEPAAALLRGDAQRLLGRHLEAEAAFASAAADLTDDARKPR